MQDVDVSNYQQPNMAHLGQAEVAKHTIFTNSNIYSLYIVCENDIKCQLTNV